MVRRGVRHYICFDDYFVGAASISARANIEFAPTTFAIYFLY